MSHRRRDPWRTVAMVLLIPVWAACSSCISANRNADVLMTQEKMSDATEQQIRQLQQAWMQAWKEKDRATLERILADDYRLIVSASPQQPVERAGWLALALGDYVAESFEYGNMVVRQIGDIVSVSSTLKVKASIKGVDRSIEFFVVDLWQKRDGRWQVVQRYSSLPEPRSASSRNLVETP